MADEPLRRLCRGREFLGARFTATEAGAGARAARDRRARPHLRRRRRLGAQPRRRSPARTPFTKADVVIDAMRDPKPSTRADAAGGDGARARQPWASPRGAGVDRAIAHWAKTVESRGFALVPISAVAIKPKSSQRRRRDRRALLRRKSVILYPLMYRFDRPRTTMPWFPRFLLALGAAAFMGTNDSAPKP